MPRWRFRQPWVYIVVHDVDGKDYLLGPYSSEKEAREKGFISLKGNVFDLKTYNTHDLSEANRRFKMERLEQSGDIRSAVKPVGHIIKDAPTETEGRNLDTGKIFYR